MKNNVKNISWHNLYIELSDKCNLSCSYCYNDSSKQKSQMLSTETVIQLIDQAKSLGVSRIDLSGGEPLLYPNIKKLINHIEQNGMSVNIITNATYFEKWLVTETKSTFQITLDGKDLETHSKTRSIENYYDVIKALNIIHDYNVGKRVMLRCNLSRYNESQIKEYIQFALTYGVNGITFGALLPMGRCENIYSDISIYRDYNSSLRLFNQLECLAKEFEGKIKIIYPEPKHSYGCPLFSDEIELNAKIDSEGYIFACSLFSNKELALGNIEKNKLNDNVTYENLYNLISGAKSKKENDKHCQKCLCGDTCAGGCMASFMQEDKKHFETCIYLKHNYKDFIKQNIDNFKIVL